MLILALDSTALTGAVALCEDETCLAEYTLNTGNTHSETLLPMVESVLKICGKKTTDIDLFCCTAGPGSFTGVRIGVSTVKGLAFGSEKPCIGVSTLEVLAENGAYCDGILCPAMNARRAQVYNALFRACDGICTRLCDDRALAIAELGQELALHDEPIYLMGDGAQLVCEGLPVLAGRLHPMPPRLLPPSGYHTAQCALRAYRNGRQTTDSTLAPTYLRPSQAERTRADMLAKQGG